MTGGAFKNSSNLLSRRREIEEFEKTVAMLKADMDAMEKQVSEVKNSRGGLLQCHRRDTERAAQSFGPGKYRENECGADPYQAERGKGAL